MNMLFKHFFATEINTYQADMNKSFRFNNYSDATVFALNWMDFLVKETSMSVHPKLIWSTGNWSSIFSRDIVYVNGPTSKNGKMKSLTFPRNNENQENSILTNQNTAQWSITGRKESMLPKVLLTVVDHYILTLYLSGFLMKQISIDFSPIWWWVGNLG